MRAYQSQLRTSHFRKVAELWLLVLWLKFTPVKLLDAAQKNSKIYSAQLRRLSMQLKQISANALQDWLTREREIVVPASDTINTLLHRR